MAECNTPEPNLNASCFQYKRMLIYHPSNSKKGFAIKGTNLRVSLVWT